MSININNIWIAWRTKIDHILHGKIDNYLRRKGYVHIEDLVYDKHRRIIAAILEEINAAS